MPKVAEAYRDARRQQILTAAAHCFAREGFHRTTMDDIVREAHLSPGAIYRYFAGKDAIIDAIAAARHAQEAELVAAGSGGDTATALRAAARAFILPLDSAGERQDRRVAIQLWSEALRNPRLRARARTGIARPRRVLADLVRDGQRRGDVTKSLDPDNAARAMIALFQGFVLQKAWEPRLPVEPYLATIDLMIMALLRSTSDRRRARKAVHEK